MRSQLRKANVLYCIAAWGLILANVLAVVWAVLAPESYARVQLPLSGLVELVLLGVPAAVLMTRRDTGFAARFSPRGAGYSLWTVAPMALGGFLLFTGLNAVITTLVARTGANVENDTAQVILSGSFWTVFLVVSLVPGVVEEMLLRGVLLPAYAHRGKWFAILLSAFLFAFLHGQPIAFAAQLAMGVVLGYLCWESRSIYPSMLYHAMHNGITSLTILLAQVSPDEVQAAEAAQSLTALVPVYWGMIALGGVIFAVCLVFFRMMCRADRAEQVRRGLYPDAQTQTPCGAVEGEAPRHAWLPMGIGLAGSVLINILGFVNQFWV